MAGYFKLLRMVINQVGWAEGMKPNIPMLAFRPTINGNCLALVFPDNIGGILQPDKTRWQR